MEIKIRKVETLTLQIFKVLSNTSSFPQKTRPTISSMRLILVILHMFVLSLFRLSQPFEGTGLSDETASPGEFIFELASLMSYDGLTIGNHELFTNEAIQVVKDYATRLGERYNSIYFSSVFDQHSLLFPPLNFQVSVQQCV